VLTLLQVYPTARAVEEAEPEQPAALLGTASKGRARARAAELAAARVRVLSPEQIAARPDDRCFRLLELARRMGRPWYEARVASSDQCSPAPAGARRMPSRPTRMCRCTAYSRDARPGDTNGQQLVDFGGTWSVMNPLG
jgi:hypothetical protein